MNRDVRLSMGWLTDTGIHLRAVIPLDRGPERQTCRTLGLWDGTCGKRHYFNVFCGETGFCGTIDSRLLGYVEPSIGRQRARGLASQPFGQVASSGSHNEVSKLPRDDLLGPFTRIGPLKGEYTWRVTSRLLLFWFRNWRQEGNAPRLRNLMIDPPEKDDACQAKRPTAEHPPTERR